MAVTINGSGQIIVQVQSVTKLNDFATTSLSFVDVTGLSVTITPTSASNRILIFANVSIINRNGNTRWAYNLVRNSTNISIADSAGSRLRVTTGDESNDTARGNLGTAGAIFLDSPSTTSATTYKIQTAAIDGGTTIVNQTMADTDSTTYFRTTSSITVMEISGT
jgi:hypothetical protein